LCTFPTAVDHLINFVQNNSAIFIVSGAEGKEKAQSAMMKRDATITRALLQNHWSLLTSMSLKDTRR
jgi:hypothetical protein